MQASMALRSSGVSTAPGWIELARMPSRAWVTAVLLVSNLTAPLEA
jgi:hypothetical protein